MSFSKNKGKKPGTLEGMIVQDADRLDAMGAVGIARTFAYGGSRGRSIEESVERAKKYISGALAAMLDLGKGSGPMDHAFAINNEFTAEKEDA